MAEYKLTTSGTILKGNMSIPPDQLNSDYRDYLIWVADNNIPDPADPEPSRATELSPSQQIILADGIDVAQITITGEPGATVEYTVNSEPFSTVLDESGMDVIELVCDTPNTTLVVQAGTARAVIYSVEVPS